MKYSFMTFSCPTLSLGEVLAMAKKFGYDGIEPRIGSRHGHGIELDAPPARRAEIRKQADATGIALCCLATSCKYADPATRAAMIAETLQSIDLAADVGAPIIRVFGGALPKELSRGDATRGLADALRAVADHAKDRGVTVCMETHDDWSNPEHLAAVIRLVNHPNIAVNWDIMHPVRAGGSTMDQAFQALRPWIRHVHFHDGSRSLEKLQMVPIGEGEIDHRRAVELLKSVGFVGYLSGEWINWEPAETHLPRELGTMKRYERQIK